MKRVLFDSNIWNKLADDSEARSCIRELCESGALVVLIPETLRHEFESSPWKGVPNWFPTLGISDSVFVLDYSRLDEARLGPGTIFSAHRGSSNKISDAILADVANTDGSLFVTDDRRARTRYLSIAGSAVCMDYESFRKNELGLSPTRA